MPSSKEAAVSDKELQRLRQLFHAQQFKYTSALAAVSGKASEGVFRIQVKPQLETTAKEVKTKKKVVYETIFALGDGSDLCVGLEPEYDCFKHTEDESEDGAPADGEWPPDDIVKALEKSHRRRLDEVLFDDVMLSEKDRQAIVQRREARIQKKKQPPPPPPAAVVDKKKESKEKDKKEDVDKSKTTKSYAPKKEKKKVQSDVKTVTQDSVEQPAVDAVKPDSEPKALMAPSPGDNESACRERAPAAVASSMEVNLSTESMEDSVRSSVDPVFDCVENEIILDDTYLSEIAHGLKEGKSYDDNYIDDDLKKKLLDIDSNKVVDSGAMDSLRIPIVKDETATRIIEKLSNYEVVAKMVSVQDSLMLKEYFEGHRKADEEVIKALDRVIERILDNAYTLYENKEEVQHFLRNRPLAKTQVLDAMILKKGNWLQDMTSAVHEYGMAFMKSVNDAYVKARELAEQSKAAADKAAYYASKGVNIGAEGFYKAVELAEQSKDMANKAAAIAARGAVYGAEVASAAASASSTAVNYGAEKAVAVTDGAGALLKMLPGSVKIAKDTSSNTSKTSSELVVAKKKESILTTFWKVFTVVMFAPYGGGSGNSAEVSETTTTKKETGDALTPVEPADGGVRPLPLSVIQRFPQETEDREHNGRETGLDSTRHDTAGVAGSPPNHSSDTEEEKKAVQLPTSEGPANPSVVPSNDAKRDNLPEAPRTDPDSGTPQ